MRPSLSGQLVLLFLDAGSNRGELCVWMMPDSVSADEAAAVAAERAVELYRGRALYMQGPRFEPGPIVGFWDEKLQQALAASRSGMRASGDAFRLQTHHASLHLSAYSEQSRRPCRRGRRPSRRHRKAESGVGSHLRTCQKIPVFLSLSRRERQVLDALAEGRINNMIARDLGIIGRTIEAHRTRLLKQLEVRSMAGAVRLATLSRLIIEA